jgi:hypothetical protein
MKSARRNDFSNTVYGVKNNLNYQQIAFIYFISYLLPLYASSALIASQTSS